MNRRYTISPAILIVLLLTIATVGTYWPVQKYDFVNFDDDEYVFNNPHVKTGLTLKNVVWAFTKGYAANWHPLTWISHMVDCEIFGLNAGGHHLINLYIHLANTLLLFFLLKKMTAATWRSAFVAALFALHPLHVESVAWIAERKDVLSAFFFLLTIWAYRDYAQRPGPGPYVRVSLWFIMGLMSKPMLVTLPFLLLVLDFWPLNRFPDSALPAKHWTDSVKTWWDAFKPLFVEKLPLIALSIGSCVVTIIAQKTALAPIGLLNSNGQRSHFLCPIYHCNDRAKAFVNILSISACNFHTALCSRMHRACAHQRCRFLACPEVSMAFFRLVVVFSNYGTGHRIHSGRRPGAGRSVYVHSAHWLVYNHFVGQRVYFKKMALFKGLGRCFIACHCPCRFTAYPASTPLLAERSYALCPHADGDKRERPGAK